MYKLKSIGPKVIIETRCHLVFKENKFVKFCCRAIGQNYSIPMVE